MINGHVDLAGYQCGPFSEVGLPRLPGKTGLDVAHPPARHPSERPPSGRVLAGLNANIWDQGETSRHWLAAAPSSTPPASQTGPFH